MLRVSIDYFAGTKSGRRDMGRRNNPSNTFGKARLQMLEKNVATHENDQGASETVSKPRQIGQLLAGNASSEAVKNRADRIQQ